MRTGLRLILGEHLARSVRGVSGAPPRGVRPA